MIAVLKLKKSCNFRGWPSVDTDSRRLELQKLEALGFSQVEIVKELSQKAACSKRIVYNDFET